jgi:hypothetical protein
VVVVVVVVVVRVAAHSIAMRAIGEADAIEAAQVDERIDGAVDRRTAQPWVAPPQDVPEIVGREVGAGGCEFGQLFGDEALRARGVPVRMLGPGCMIALALTVSEATLLLFALLRLPAAIAQQVTNRPYAAAPLHRVGWLRLARHRRRLQHGLSQQRLHQPAGLWQLRTCAPAYLRTAATSVFARVRSAMCGSGRNIGWLVICRVQVHLLAHLAALRDPAGLDTSPELLLAKYL